MGAGRSFRWREERRDFGCLRCCGDGLDRRHGRDGYGLASRKLRATWRNSAASGQTVIALWPTMRNAPVNFAIAIVPIRLCAAFSWHVVERPILARRKAIVGVTAQTTVGID